MGKEGQWPDRQCRTGQKTTPGYSDPENVIAISAEKGYKTTRKPNQSPTVMNRSYPRHSCVHISSRDALWTSEIAMYVVKKLLIERGFSRLRVMRWFLSNDPNNSARGLTKCLLYLGKRFEPFNSLRLNPTENIMHNMQKTSIKRELPSTAVNSQINRPDVTLHFFWFIGDFEKDLSNRMRHYITSKLTMLLHKDEILINRSWGRYHILLGIEVAMMIVARGALAPRAKNQHGNRDSEENMPPECSICFTLALFGTGC